MFRNLYQTVSGYTFLGIALGSREQARRCADVGVVSGGCRRIGLVVARP